jgi:uncharacterized protein YgbK (DUF1537 family)
MVSCIIADDLTGAADTGIQFAKRGFYTLLLPFCMKDAEASHQLHEAQVLAFNTSSRGMAAESAYSAVRNPAVFLKKLHPGSIYKKIDSTLRGNLGIEIEAVMDAVGSKVTILAPAFPDCNRTTVDGVHLVNGRPLSETEAASDPVSPVRESHIPTLIRAQTKLKVGHIELEEIRFGVTSLQRSILQHVKDGEKIIVFDAFTNCDLKNIAKTSISLPFLPLMVGSAGLADQVSKLLTPSEHAASIIDKKNSEGVIIVISGSLSAVTSRQLDEVRRTGRGKIVRVGIHKLVEDPAVGLQRETEIVSELVSEAEVGGVIGIQSVTEGRCEAKDMPLLVVEYLGRVTLRVVRECPHPTKGLILTGGDTALAVFKHLGIFRVRLIDEILPGIPCGQVMDGEFAGLPIITKAGAFGDESALVDCVNFMA